MTVVVFGNATLDLAYATAHLPRPGETVLAEAPSRGPGGKGLNQAVAAHLAGAGTRFVSAVGADGPGGELRAAVAAFGLDTEGMVVATVPTDTSLIFVAAGGENAIVSTCAAARSLTPENARGLPVAEGDTLLVQGNLSRATTAAALETARAAGARTMANPAPIAFDWAPLLPLVDHLVVNEVEALILTVDMPGGPPELARALLRSVAGSVTLTLGARGAVFAGAAGVRSFDAPAARAVDSTGAGDMVCGALAALLDGGRGPEEAVPRALALASLSVTRPGAAASYPTRAEAARVIDG